MKKVMGRGMKQITQPFLSIKSLLKVTDKLSNAGQIKRCFGTAGFAFVIAAESTVPL